MASDAVSEYSVAVQSAYGLGAPQDLQGALHHLQVAADLGHSSARTELAALVGNWRLVADIERGKRVPDETWARLRAAVDVKTWLAFPDARPVSAEPRIAMVKRFISPAACDWFIERARPHLVRQQTFEAESGAPAEDGARTNTGAEFLPERADTLLSFVRARLSALAYIAGVAEPSLETSQVLHYEVGEQFAPHYDFLNVRHAGHARQVAEHGQRVLTILVYLNDDYEGGETYFPKLQRGFKGRAGDALVFSNVTPDGAPDPLTLHMGSSPTRGEKWLFSQWIRARA